MTSTVIPSKSTNWQSPNRRNLPFPATLATRISDLSAFSDSYYSRPEGERNHLIHSNVDYLNSIALKLMATPFFTAIQEILKSNCYETCVSYGIGSFSSLRMIINSRSPPSITPSMIQFALLLAIRPAHSSSADSSSDSNSIKTASSSISSSPPSPAAVCSSFSSIKQFRVFDPLFTALDIEIIKSLGFHYPNENDIGKYNINTNNNNNNTSTSTLFYLPHCSQLLTENIIYENLLPSTADQNSHPLKNIGILGNSIELLSRFRYGMNKFHNDRRRGRQEQTNGQSQFQCPAHPPSSAEANSIGTSSSSSTGASETEPVCNYYHPAICFLLSRQAIKFTCLPNESNDFDKFPPAFYSAFNDLKFHSFHSDALESINSNNLNNNNNSNGSIWNRLQLECQRRYEERKLKSHNNGDGDGMMDPELIEGEITDLLLKYHNKSNPNQIENGNKK